MLSLIFLFLVLLSNSVYADDFTETGDTSQNMCFQTISFSVGEFPESSISPNGISYDGELLLGEENTDLLNFSYLTNFGGMRRIPDLADRVEGPPGTKVDIMYYFKNDANHDINIEEVLVPFSQNEMTMGDLSSVLDFENILPTHRLVSVTFNGFHIEKDGLFKSYPGPGSVTDGSSGKYLLETVSISNPLDFKSYEILQVEGGYKMKVYVRNTGDELLSNLRFEHQDYIEEFSLEAYSETALEYVITNEDIGYYRIYNPNIKTVCSVVGAQYYDWLAMRAVSVFGYRDDGGFVNGAYVQPEVESFCIKRIPYTMNSKEIAFEEELVSENILGIMDEEISILPKTSKGDSWFLLFLVVDVYLWYSFVISRRKNES